MVRKNTCTPVFIAELFTIVKTWKQPKCPLTDKKDVAHIHSGVLAIKKNETMPFAATWMYLEIIILSKSLRER